MCRLFAVFAIVLAFAAAAYAEDVVPLHSTGGTVGPNGVKERVAFKIMKTVPGKDQLALLVDLGDHRFDSNQADGMKNRIITLQLGTLSIQGQTDDKAQAKSATFKLRLVAHGAGLRIDIKKETFTNLLSELTGRSGDVDLQLTILSNHLPATAAEAGPRHATTIYSKLLGLEVSESAKILVGRG